MFCLFEKVRIGEKGQLASILVIVLVVFIMLAFLTVNLGKIGLTRTRLSNATDAAALAAGSVASQLLNTITSYNEGMLLNFVGFCMMIQLMIFFWILDFVKFIVKVAMAYIGHLGGPATEIPLGEEALMAIMNMNMSSIIIGLMIYGATEVSKAYEEYIDDLNSTDKICKYTRNTGRIYGFMNAGIDEPKIKYSDWLADNGRSDSDDSWKQYLNVETGYTSFMRKELQDINKGTDYENPNTVSYQWQDRRLRPNDSSSQERIVQNIVQVNVKPFQRLNLSSVTFGDLAFDNSLKSQLTTEIAGNANWFMGTWAIEAIYMTPVILILLTLMQIIITILSAIIALWTIIIGISMFWEGVCDIFFCACCIQTAGAVTFVTYLIAIGIVVTSIAATVTGLQDPSEIIALVMDKGSDYTLSVEVVKKTELAGGSKNLDYGFWEANYSNPLDTRGIVSYSKAEAMYGTIFPPSTYFTPMIKEIK